MQNEKIHLERIKRFVARQKESVYTLLEPLKAQYIKADDPIPYAELNGASWHEIAVGEVWNKVWGSAWFKVRGKLSDTNAIELQGLYFDCQGEACVMIDGTPYMGLTPKVDWYHNAAKHYVPLAGFADVEGNFELYIEAAANDLFGAGKDEYRLFKCSLCVFDTMKHQFALDVELLLDLANSLPDKTVRRAKIIYGLNEICNIFASQPDKAQQIAKELLAKPANASALKAYSVGHAHLDLAWLWHIRESRRKGGRTFANALRLLEQYPSYVFGASQAQLYQWIKDDYPQLYIQVQDAIKGGRWEVQGASWVEFDTNLTGGESIIRQFRYGRAFFAEEFGIVPHCLWLPDCFGFSANLPQLMQGCGVDYFVTQKLSWNESNTFDKHLFIWQGIDGSEVRAHQLPTNDYNFSNNPSAFIATEGRFTQSELAEAYLNLYGIGDGGGGPTKNHIEYGLRQQDLEGSSRFIFAKAEEFFAEYAKIPADKLPKCYTELYLEFHRGTYTTQAVMKKDNYISERLLAAAEWLSALANLHQGKQGYPEELHPLWKDTLLMQFHDILPGSSITRVYKEAHELSSNNHRYLREFIDTQTYTVDEDDCYSIFNPTAAELYTWLSFPSKYRDYAAILNCCEVSHVIDTGDELRLLAHLQPYSKSDLVFELKLNPLIYDRKELRRDGGAYLMQGSCLTVKVSDRGSIIGILRGGQEFLSGESNLVQLWEDEPNNWGAWDINHFYRETTPQQAEQAELVEAYSIGDYHCIIQEFCLGKSRIKQTIELMPAARYVLIHHEVDWQEHHQMLRVAFNSNIFSQQVECGVQMGKITRSSRPKNAWEAARFDFPAQGFVASCEASRCCAILSAAKYGFSANENRLELALLRSPADVDPQADLGRQNYSYGFFCDNINFADSHLAELAEAIEPQIICRQGISSLSPSDIQLGFSSLVLSSVKPADEGNAIILRYFEPVGKHTREQLFTSLPVTGIYKCNLLEEPLDQLDNMQDIYVKPFEIITLRLELGDDTPSA